MSRGLLAKEEDDSMHDAFLAEIKKYMSRAEKLDAPELWSLFTDVYAEVPDHLRRQASEAGISIPDTPERPRVDETNTAAPWESH